MHAPTQDQECDEGHERDVEVRCLQVVAGRIARVAILCTIKLVAEAALTVPTILTLYSEWEQDDECFFEDILVGDIEVVFKHVQVAPCQVSLVLLHPIELHIHELVN